MGPENIRRGVGERRGARGQFPTCRETVAAHLIVEEGLQERLCGTRGTTGLALV